MKIYIINPDNGKRVSIEEWRKDSNPTRARSPAARARFNSANCPRPESSSGRR